MDHHATTPVDPRVLEVMLPYFGERFGNAASRSHAYGWHAEEAVERARQEVGELVGSRKPSQEIVFTSGATESDNLALKGVIRQGMAEGRGDHLITVKTEHKAVIDSAKRLEAEGAKVTWLEVDSEGRVSPDDLAKAIRPETLLVSIMLANNETGTIQDMAAIGRVTREREVLLHCDATQGVGRVPFQVDELGVDLVSFTAHKIYGPKGAGALYVRKTGPHRVRILADMDGGGHEKGMRSGTLNVPGIVGLGAACKIMQEEGQQESVHIAALRDRLFDALQAELGELHLNGAPAPHRMAGNLNLSFPYLEGESLILALQKRVAVSSGSACNSASVEPSYVLRAMGLSKELADASIRFGLGRGHTEAIVDEVADFTIRQVKKLRKLSPSWQLKEQGINPSDISW